MSTSACPRAESCEDENTPVDIFDGLQCFEPGYLFETWDFASFESSSETEGPNPETVPRAVSETASYMAWEGVMSWLPSREDLRVPCLPEPPGGEPQGLDEYARASGL